MSRVVLLTLLCACAVWSMSTSSTFLTPRLFDDDAAEPGGGQQQDEDAGDDRCALLCCCSVTGFTPSGCVGLAAQLQFQEAQC